MIAFHNGRFVPQAELTLGFHDAGFAFGATVTDFCRTYRQKLFRWPDHLARLRHDAAACFIPLPYTDDELTAAAEQLVEENAKSLSPDDDLALITFATPGPLGYMVGSQDNGPPTVAMHTFPIPKERYRRFFTEGVTLTHRGFNPLPEESAKHRSRMHWWKVARQAADPGVVPMLFTRQAMPDTAIGGVLCVRDGTMYAPPSGTVLDSISVRVVEELCVELSISFERRANWLSGKVITEEWLLAGSAFGIAGVKVMVGMRGTRSEYSWPGPVFTKLAAAWSEMVGVDPTLSAGYSAGTMNTKSVFAAVALSGTIVAAQSPKDAEGKFNPESAKMFAAKIQPILTNRCADCHARKDHGSGFQLKAIDPGINDPQGADANLRATAKWITPANPHASPLLVHAATAHAKLKEPPLPNAHVAYKQLELWVHWACGPDGSAMPSSIPPAPAPAQPSGAIQQVSATGPTGFATGGKSESLPPPPPTDPFDPATFNRSAHPPKK
jgi:branched-chain amino acid aminotransferase